MYIYRLYAYTLYNIYIYIYIYMTYYRTSNILLSNTLYINYT